MGPSSRASIDGGLGDDFGDGDGAERGGGDDSEAENSDHDEVDVTDVSSESGEDLPRKTGKAKELRQSLVSVASVGGGESSTRTDSPPGSLQSASLPRKDLDGENRVRHRLLFLDFSFSFLPFFPLFSHRNIYARVETLF